MELPSEFSFSQQNLQDFLDCPRRFELRHVNKLAWPAVRSEPVLELERHMRLGERFHQMVQQHQLGLPEEIIANQTTEVELDQWWKSYLLHPPTPLPDSRLAEFNLAAPFAGYRLVAKYDLIAIESGKQVIIVDWKTNRKPIPRSTLIKRVQSRLYPFLLVQAGSLLNNGKKIQPEIIEMIYWFTADALAPVHLQYSEMDYKADLAFLLKTINQIETSPSPFTLTPNEKQCLFCIYRSLCKRGTNAGNDSDGDLDEVEGALLLDLEFDQIAEIEF